jgi:exonuclease SbcC
MIPVLLKMEGFLSYQDPVEINFTGFDLACITGENGAGKSSILDAVTWVIFGKARRHDESLINLNSNQALVSLIFDYEGNRYKITRINPRGESKQVELYLQKDLENADDDDWLPLTERTIRETDQKISDILRLDYESFINASFFLQGEADLFTQQNPSTRKKILSQILGLEIWEIYRKGASEKRRSTESEINQLDGRLAEINAELDQEVERNDQLKKLELDLQDAQENRAAVEKELKALQAIQTSLDEQRKLVQTLEHQTETISKNINKTKEKINLRKSEQEQHESNRKNAKLINEEYQSWQTAQESLSDWEKIAEQYRESEIKRQEPLLQIAAEKARLLQEKTSLESQDKDIRTKLKKIPELTKQLELKKRAIQEAEDQLEEREKKNRELELARQNQANARAENPLLYQEMKDLEKRISELESAEGALCPLCGQELAKSDRSALIKRLKDDGKIKGDKYRTNQSTLKEADLVVKDLELKITELSLAENNLRLNSQDADKIINQISHLEELRSSWDKNQKGALQEIDQLLKNENYALEARKQLKALNAELKKIGYDADEHDKARELVNQGTKIQDKKLALDKAEAALKPLARDIKDLLDQNVLDQKELDKLLVELDLGQKKLLSREENAPNTKKLESQILDLKEGEKVLERQVGAAQQKVTVLKQQKERKKKLETQRLDLSSSVKKYKQLEGAFGKDGVPALLIEQALPNIESKANQILDKLSGGGMSIRFVTQREYKDSGREDLKETLDIQIRDQSGFRDYELYSGGEAFRINFAIRLALSNVLAQRAGAKLQTLVIDEGFGSQDSVGRQRLIEAINLIQDDFEKILVITHVEQIKESFSTQLLVEKTPRGSLVTLV